MLTHITGLLESALRRRPMTTNILMYGSLSGLAELSQQSVINKLSISDKDADRRNYNLKTVCHYALLGGSIAPVLVCWYRWLDSRLPGTAARVVAKKVSLDICVFALPYYSAFYLCLNIMAGVSLSETRLELKQKMIPTIAATTAFWVPAQTLNFRFVPLRYRVVFLSGCTFVEFNILAVLKKWKVSKET